MTKVLFIGNFLSKSRGTMGISEKLVDEFKNDKSITIKLTSRLNNTTLRAFDILLCTLFLQFDIAHVDVYSGKSFYYALLASFILKLRGKPYICTLRGGMLHEFYSKNSNLVKKITTNASKIQTPSHFLKNYFKTKGISVDYLPNYIMVDKFPYLRNNYEQYSVLWVRAFDNIYNPILALKILINLQYKYPGATMTMIGPDLGIRSSVEKFIAKNGLSNSVKIIGSVKNNQLYKYYQSHHVFLNTTQYESFGAAVLEAASCGIPIISTSVGEIPLIWENEKEMLLIKNHEPSLFANSISKIFDSNDFSNFLSINARKKAELYDWSMVRPMWQSIIKT